jgi:hypothetical protein
MACRLIISPITGQEVKSKTWNDIYNLVDKNEEEADRIYSMLSSRQFLQWFGDWINNPQNASKVVNDIGEPKIVYRGESSLFGKSEFTEDIVRPTQGVYFTDNIKVAKKHANRYEISNAQLYPVFLNVRNPINITQEQFYSEQGPFTNLSDYEAYVEDAVVTDTAEDNNQWGEVHQFYYVLNPNSIKSVFNRGSYIASNPDVTVEPEYPEYENFHFIVRDKGRKVGRISVNNNGEFLTVFMTQIANLGTANVGTNAYLQVAEWARNNGLTLRSDRISDRMSEAAKRLWRRFLLVDQAEVQQTDEGSRYIFTGAPSSVTGNIYAQAEDTESSVASPETLKKVKEFLQRIGVDTRLVNQIVVNGQKIGATGVADTLNKLIQVVNGKENVALTEEAAHFAVELLEQTGNPLFNQMMNKISSYDLYKATFAQYKSIYTKDGKPDVRKIKKEAIGKVLAEYIIKQEEGFTEKPELLNQTKNWWRQILEFLKGLIGKAGGFNPFEQAVAETVGNEGIVEVRAVEGQMFQLDKSEEVFNKLKEKHNQITKVDNGEENFYEVGGKRVAHRVTDKAKAYEEGLFKTKSVTPEQEKAWNIKKEKGTAGHKDMEDIFNMYVDPTTGFKREIPLDRPGLPNIGSEKIWNKLHDNFVERLNTFPANTRFMSEVMIYDEVTDTAGTIDFLAISPSGEISIYDWKFIDINTEKTKDIPWYKKRSFNIQLGAYKDILSKRYNLKNFKQVRIIPIKATYSYTNKKTRDSISLLDVKIGSTDVSEIEEDYLLPFALEGESTGNVALDKLIAKLNAVLHKIEISSSKKGEQFEKIEQINTLNSAIRKLQIQGNAELLVEQGLGLMKRYQDLIKSYETEFEGKSASDIPKETQEAMAEQLFDAHSILDVYSDVDIILKNMPTKLDKDLLDKLQDLSSNSRYIKRQIEEVSKRLTSDFVAKGVGIGNLLIPERAVAWLKKNFRTFSQAHTAATRVLYKLIDPILQKTDIEFNIEARKLAKIKEDIDKWASEKGIATKDVFKPLLSFDEKGRWRGKLIDKIDRKFYEDFKRATETSDIEWFEENVDLEAYENWYKEYREKRVKQINEGRYFADDEKNEKKREDLIKKLDSEYSLKEDSAYGNWRMRQLAIESKWLSTKYKDLLRAENAPLLALYNYTQERLRKSYDIGLLDAYKFRTFVPNVRADWVERQAFGSGPSQESWIQRNLAVQPDDQIYGYKDPLTGEVIDTVGAWYINDLGHKVTKEGETFVDYSDKSTDLIKVFALWNEQIIKYEYLTEVENRVRLLHMTEGLKSSIATNQFGAPLRERDANGKIVADRIIEIENNETNQEYLKKFIDYYLYGKQMTDAASFDVMIPNFYNKMAKAVNKKVGMQVMNEMDTEGSSISLAKTISTMNRFFQMKVMGLNVATSVSNLVGGTITSAVNAGTWFTKSDLVGGYAKLGSTRFHDTQGKKLAGLLNHFVPLLDNRKFETARRLSVSSAVDYLSSDWLFALQRGSDKVVQYPIAIAMLNNSTVIDGKIVNIRQYVRDKNAFGDRYNLSRNDRLALENKVEQEIEEMKKSSNLVNQVSIENDEIKFPEEISLDEQAKFRSFIQQMTKNAVGNSTKEDINQIRLGLIGQSLMMFKNWIPRLIDVRFSELRYNVGTDHYEYGRARMFMKAVVLSIIKQTNVIGGMISGSEKGIQFIKDIYLEKVKEFESRGEEFTMTEGEFIDMYIQSVKAELQELGILLGLFSGFLAMKSAIPDDDDDRTKGFWKYATKLSDKVTQELSFFYSPSSIAQIGNGSLFPSLGLLVDVQNIVKHVSTQAFGFTVSNEEIQESAKPLKYTFKTFPATKELVTWVALFNKDLGDELGIKITAEARQNR